MGDEALAEAQTLTRDLAVSGELTLVAGPTGSGKTTLLTKALHDWRFDHPGRWPGAVLLGQNPATQLVADTVEEEIAFALVAAQMPATEITRRTRRALAAFELKDRAAIPTDALSMGWKCRTLLAALDALEPDAVFLDEPYAQLDDDGRAGVDAAIARWLTEGRAVTVSADRVLDIFGGQPSCRTHLLRAETGICPEPDLAATFCKSWPRRAHLSQGSPVLELRSFSTGYENEPPILREIDLVLSPGTICVVSGANGSGKSSLLRGIVGDMPASSGMRRISGRTLAGNGRLAQDTALVLQDPELHLTGRTVRGEIELAGVLSDVGHETSLRFFGLSHLAERASLSLSHGQKQVLALAGAVVSAPRLLLLDEAFCGLDADAMAGILAALKEVVRHTGLAVLAATHDPSAAVLRVADQHLRVFEASLANA